jgi:hypothetical protein
VTVAGAATGRAGIDRAAEAGARARNRKLRPFSGVAEGFDFIGAGD